MKLASHYALRLLAVTCLVPLASTAWADDGGKWYGKLYGGYSMLGDTSFDQEGVAAAGATGDTDSDGGFLAGGAVGYNFTNNIAAELAWDYITNDTTATFSDGTRSTDGDFSSSIFFLNGFYKFDPVSNTKIRPYLGAGIGYVEEIDMDLKIGPSETSYSSDGDFAYQIMAGASYPITDRFDFNTDIRYVRVDSVDLEREGGTGKLKSVDYDPVILTLGASYKF